MIYFGSKSCHFIRLLLKPQLTLPDDGNPALQDFLNSLNPRQQQSTTLESYLIKPIQRILKYPLLLTQLKNLTRPQSEEAHQLGEALAGMEKVGG